MLAHGVVLVSVSGFARRRADELADTRWDDSTPMMAGRVADIDPGGEAGGAQEAQVAAESLAESRDHERSL
jgi:hypothetical protein